LGVGFGGWGVGARAPPPNPQSPIPNPQSPLKNFLKNKIILKLNLKLILVKNERIFENY
jgi:hypothetical protein